MTPTRCFCVFEGGGAKGIAHIGALQALEEANFKLEGFAGTSAGAIIAALAACGYKSDELFSADGSILDVIDGDKSNTWGGSAFHPLKSPTKLMGRLGWVVIRGIRRVSRAFGLLMLFVGFVAVGLPYWLNLISAPTTIALQSLTGLFLLSLPFLLVYPAASLKPMAAAINQAVSLKVRRDRNTKPVTFADLADAGFPPLKIVATDISARSLVLFSADTTPQTSIGDAVAASACLPAVFRAHRVDDRLCYDGGLVSNLPAWAFDSERAVDRDVWTAVVEIGEASAPKAPNLVQRFVESFVARVFGKLRPRGIGIISATLSTAVFGAGVLNTRNVSRLRSQPLEVDLGLLEFDLTREQAAEVIASAARESRANIVYQMEKLPRLLEDMCKFLSGQALGLINIARTAEGLARYDGRIRVALFFATRDDAHSLVSEFSHGFGLDADERIILPIKSSFVGRVWREREGYYLGESDRKEWNSYLSRLEDRWVRKLRWGEMSWIIAVPYYQAAAEQHIVVAMDSDKPLEITNLEPLLSSIFMQIETMLDFNLPLEAFTWLK